MKELPSKVQYFREEGWMGAIQIYFISYEMPDIFTFCKRDVWHLFFHALICPILDSQERWCGWVFAIDPHIRLAFIGV